MSIMIGVPLVGLAFGEAGLVTLFTLISVHSLLLLTSATVVFELAAARERRGQAGQVHVPMWRTVLQAVRNGIVHPVPLPIMAGLLFAQTGLELPQGVDKPLQLLGQALGPLALLLVGVMLAFSTVGVYFRVALRIALVKNLALPLVLAVLGWALGLSGLSLAVMIVIAALPVGTSPASSMRRRALKTHRHRSRRPSRLASSRQMMPYRSSSMRARSLASSSSVSGSMSASNGGFTDQFPVQAGAGLARRRPCRWLEARCGAAAFKA